MTNLSPEQRAHIEACNARYRAEIERERLIIGLCLATIFLTAIFVVTLLTLPEGSGGETPDCYDEPDCMETRND